MHATAVPKSRLQSRPVRSQLTHKSPAFPIQAPVPRVRGCVPHRPGTHAIFVAGKLCTSSTPITKDESTPEHIIVLSPRHPPLPTWSLCSTHVPWNPLLASCALPRLWAPLMATDSAVVKPNLHRRQFSVYRYASQDVGLCSMLAPDACRCTGSREHHHAGTRAAGRGTRVALRARGVTAGG